ncbi:hypothetical protein DFH07DRAFT_938084 [Mycena maculata]|uniref:Uncharacterized protein n=1 Tax=Mycena maculata TaxID=230809 RepID=A0AAD7JSH0_9AGAR|nr:hypothetical protein DFH07DRAFT_938084 [Mycena maculata]
MWGSFFERWLRTVRKRLYKRIYSCSWALDDLLCLVPNRFTMSFTSRHLVAPKFSAGTETCKRLKLNWHHYVSELLKHSLLLSSMSGHHGDDWPLRVTKYWDEGDQDVIYSTKPREEPIQLREILGYYAWIFNAYEEEGGREVEAGSHGGLELKLDKMKAKQPAKGKGDKKGKNKVDPVVDVDPAHVIGSFDTCDIGSAFAGLQGYSYRDCCWIFFKANIVEEDAEDKNSGDNFDFSHSRFIITVVDVLDDNGHPFIEFTHSPGIHEQDVTYVGKKQKTNNPRKKLEGLTDGERQRLGIFVEDTEIRRAALKGKPKFIHRPPFEHLDEGGPAGANRSETSEEERPEK